MNSPNRKRSLAAWLVGLFVGTGLGVSAQTVFTPGFSKAEFYTANGAGTTVADLLADPNYPATPAETLYRQGLESVVGYGDNYGVRLSGFITPPETGSYVFYISSDDGGEFYLSTDATPANLQLICNEPTWNNPREWKTPGSNATGRNVDAPENISAAKSLTAGQRYYFEALMKEGGGGDNLAVAVAKQSDPVPASGTPPVSGSWLGVDIPSAGASVQITQQPANTTSAANEDVSLSVTATGTSPLGTNLIYQWRRNGVPISGALSATLTLPRVQSADNGAKYSAVVAIPGASVISSEATLTVTPDVTPPTVGTVQATATFNKLIVTYSEPVDQASATAVANYAVSGGITVSGATLTSPDTVTLATSTLAEDTAYTLTINNVKDTYSPGNSIAANTAVAFRSWAYQSGAVLNRFYDGPTSVTALEALATFPDEPSRVRVEKAFEYPPDGAGEGGSNYGNSLEAWWTAPSTGAYIFFCSGDDTVDLYLSTDNDPANVKLIAQEPQWNNPRDWLGTLDVDAQVRRPNTENRSDVFQGSEWSPPNVINLTGGNRYFIRALHGEGGGGDNVGVTYVRQGQPEPASGTPSIPGSELGLYFDKSQSQVTINQQPASTSILEGRSATLSVGATGGWQYSDTPFYQWQSAPAGSTTFADVAGATSASYTTPVLQTTGSGVQFRVAVTVPAAGATSEVAAVTVQRDQTPPVVARVSASSSDAITVTFDETLDAATANTAANYLLAPGNLPITSAAIGGTISNVVRLEIGAAISSGAQYTLTVNGVKDLYGNTVANAASTFTARIVTYADIILADGPLAFYRFEESTGQKSANLGTFGSGGDGLFMLGTGPDDSTATDVSSEAGPRPPAFLGFAGSNRAANFKGPDDPVWVDTQQAFLNGLGAFSLEYWVRPSGGRTDDPTLWLSRVGVVGQNDAIEYGFISPTTIQIWTPSGGSLDTTYSFPDNEWHHVATIASGQDIRNYFDGVLVGTGGSATGNYGTSTFNVHIGGGGVFDGTGNFFIGQIDEVAIFNKAIPAARILAHFKAGKEGGVIEEEQAKFTKSTVTGGNLSLEWTGGGTLQSAPAVTGSWTDVAGAASPYSTAASAAAAFYRVRN